MEYTIYIKGMYDNRAGVGAAAWICVDKEEVLPIPNGLRWIQLIAPDKAPCFQLKEHKEHFQLELYALYCAIYFGMQRVFYGEPHWDDDIIVVSNNTAVVAWLNGLSDPNGYEYAEPYTVLMATIKEWMTQLSVKSLKAVHMKKTDTIPRNIRVNQIAQKALNEQVMKYYSDISKHP